MILYTKNTGIKRIISIVLIIAFLTSDVAFAFADPRDSALAPPLATKPSAKIVQNPDGSLDVVTEPNPIAPKIGEAAEFSSPYSDFGNSIRSHWVFIEVSCLIGRMLYIVQNPHCKIYRPRDILIPEIKNKLTQKGGMDLVRILGLNIDGIEEVRDGDNVTGFSMPRG